MAPTKPREAKNTIQEDRIRRAPEELPSSTLSERERGGLRVSTRQEGHARPAETHAGYVDMEKAFEELVHAAV